MRVNKITAIRQVLLEELQLLQDDCNHTNFQIGMYSWRPGVHETYKICENCDLAFEPAFPAPEVLLTTSGSI